MVEDVDVGEDVDATGAIGAAGVVVELLPPKSEDSDVGMELAVVELVTGLGEELVGLLEEPLVAALYACTVELHC